MAADLEACHLDQWVAAHPDWSAGTVRNLWRAVQRLCRWGRRHRLPRLALLKLE